VVAKFTKVLNACESRDTGEREGAHDNAAQRNTSVGLLALRGHEEA
jgi:hypothetical protein